MARFHAHSSKINIRLLLFVLISGLLLLLFANGIKKISVQNLQLEQQTLEQTLHDNTVQYYALNGYFPESLDALLDSCPVHYSTDRFFIDYQPCASNIMPEITVLVRK